MNDPGIDPPPLPPPPPEPLPGRKTTWRELLMGTAISIALCLLLLPMGQILWALLLLPLLGIILVVFPATRGYGFGILITYGLAWAILLAVCGGIMFLNRH
jgi:hypothetical protein